jgi:YfiH family protein
VIVIPSPAANPDETCDFAADIIMTSHPGVAVAVQAADCVPLLFFDPATGAAAAAHAGWRGTAAGVAQSTARAMAEHFGTKAADLIVAIGPSIGPCCYRVGDELVPRFGGEGRRWFFRLAGAWMLNLWSANRDQLLDAGVKSDQIHVAELCTAMHPELFDSYRRDGAAAGRMAAAIRSAPDMTL